jgi:hypothetical protein
MVATNKRYSNFKHGRSEETYYSDWLAFIFVFHFNTRDWRRGFGEARNTIQANLGQFGLFGGLGDFAIRHPSLD